jgi:hypothetical protein
LGKNCDVSKDRDEAFQKLILAAGGNPGGPPTNVKKDRLPALSLLIPMILPESDEVSIG